jgi:hypothetical protein
VHRARRARHRHAKRLAHHVGKPLHRIDRGVPLRHRLERRHVVDLLVDLAEFGLRIAAAGHGDHRRMREVGVAQARGEVERADNLRHADAGPAAGARVAVGHVRRSLLAVTVDALDLRAALHLGEGAPKHGGHHEHMAHFVAGQHFGQQHRAGRLHLIAKGLVGEPTAPVIGSAGATNRNS